MKIEDFYSNEKVFYAHLKDNAEKETLKEHTQLCCDYFLRIYPEEKYHIFWEKLKRLCNIEEISINAEDIIKTMWYSVPFFHDMGKINPIFQKDKMDNLILDSEEMKRFLPLSSKHSLFSAVLYINTFARKIKELIENKEERRYCIYFLFCNAFVISRHHSGLSSFDKFLQSFSDGREAYEIIRILNEDYSRKIYQEQIFLKTDGNRLFGEKLEISKILKNFRKRKITEQIAPCFYTYVRILSSVLIAADYYSTTEFCNEIKTEIISRKEEIKKMCYVFENSKQFQKIRTYEQEIDRKHCDFQKVKDINVMRNELFLETEKNLLKNLEKNIFYLEAPTGSGKSNTVMWLSFLLQKMNDMERIFYVYPFNTLVEQNYNTMQIIFENIEDGMDNIAVINSLTPILMKNSRCKQENKSKQKIGEENNVKFYTEVLLDRQFLNYPIVLTTSVSLFQYLFSENQESVMGFHKFQNSIIILDEIQSYKNSIWTEIITFLNAFSEILNMKILIISATLPDLNYLLQGNCKVTRLINDRKKYYQNPVFAERVFLHYDLLEKEITIENLLEHMMRYQKDKKKILIEFIHKKSALQFYTLLKEKEKQGKLDWADIVLMTREDNQIERKRLIKLTKEERKEKGLLFIATQVVEAGVDIDMDIGYKDCSLLDAEEQFLGRINRSCKRKGEVWFFNIDNEKNVYRNDFRVISDFTIRKEFMRKILKSKDFSQYYLPLLDYLKEQNQEINENNVKLFFEEVVGTLDFKKTEEKMKLLDEKEWYFSVYLCKDIKLEDGTILNAKAIWNEYKELLKNDTMAYAEKRCLLSKIRSKMSYFIYEIKQCDFVWNDQIGELYCIEDAEPYFVDGKFFAAVFEKQEGMFI